MIYTPAGVDVNPEESIYQWEVYEVSYADGKTTRHLVGACNGDGRVSSSVQKYNKEARTVTTRSGRVYTLQGESGFYPNAHYVWLRWKDINNVISEKDVSHEYEENSF